MLKEKRISVIVDCKINKLVGNTKLESINFEKNSSSKTTDEKNKEYYIRPDIVIAENGVGSPKQDL